MNQRERRNESGITVRKIRVYPYEFNKDKTPTLEDLKKLLKKVKAKNRKKVKTPLDYLMNNDNAVNGRAIKY